ncbi:hypothetical protein EX895_000914 [Sporisorium graminicola]|uniref:Endonuclease/exonuclease/phosphatase domain-containing protein n=1 Tax=Sporisorium graminicola TaxID=280036 RepID=A0A4U7L298_9BASI|nr:hypothetical protein EX895_000914 [Sporisorium graminicola]TKY90916.1 hypothetical protein EX895_000914 [Sporisorium graminicola]
MRHRPLATLLLLSTLAFSLLLYLRFRTYDLVSVGLCRVAPSSSSCSSPRLDMLQVPSSSELITQKVHPAHYLGRTRGRISLSIGSINIRYSRDAAYDSTHSMLSTLGNMLSAARMGGVEPSAQFASSIDPHARVPPSPYLTKQYHGERSWLLRGPKVADVALFNDWDIFAFQEVLDGQYGNLIDWLGEEYGHAGVGRDDGDRAGEAVPVFWRRDTFEAVSADQGGIGKDGVEHFWLSPTPSVVGSVGWDAALTRMCTHVSLRLLATREIIHVFSTHYDHQGVVARAKSSELIVERARNASAHTRSFYATLSPPRQQQLSDPLVVLIGDLNSPRNEGSWSTLVSPHYGLRANSSGATFLDTALSVPTRFKSPLLTDNEDPLRSEYASGRKLPPPPSDGEAAKGGILSEPLGPLRTFTDFQPSPRRAIDDRIDFIMLLDNQAVLDQTRPDAVLDHSSSPPPPQRRLQTGEGASSSSPSPGGERRTRTDQPDQRWRIRSFGTLPNWSETDAGFLISDHRPVTARIQRTATL